MSKTQGAQITKDYDGEEGAFTMNKAIVLLAAAAITLNTACTHQPEQPKKNLCALDVAHMPPLVGLKLGMSIDEVKAKFPDTFDFKSLSWGKVFATSYKHIENTTQMKCDFIDGKLFSIEATYQGTKSEWREGEFARAAEEKFGLKHEWKNSIGENKERFDCDGVEISITEPYEVLTTQRLLDFPPLIEIKDTNLSAVASQKETEAMENERRQKQQEFHP